MIKILKIKAKKNIEIIGLILLILFTVISTSYFNIKKNKIEKNDDNFVENVFFKKTLNYIIDNLDPKYKKIKHIINSGETFDKILESYSVEKNEIIKIKNYLKKEVNLNKLKTKQIKTFYDKFSLFPQKISKVLENWSNRFQIDLKKLTPDSHRNGYTFSRIFLKILVADASEFPP